MPDEQEYDVTVHSGAVRTVANRYARSYPMVSRDDIEQEIWLEMLRSTHPQLLATASKPDALAHRMAVAAAHQYCRTEKAHAEGYSPHDVYDYTPQVVGHLLPIALAYRRYDELPAASGVLSDRGLANENGNIPTMMADVLSALDGLRNDQAILAYVHSGEGDTDWPAVAELFGITAGGEAARKRVARAERSMADALNGMLRRDHDGPGARHVESNASARHRTAKQESGER